MIRRFTWDIVYHDSIESTNSLLYEQICNDPHISEGRVVKADFQTRGKGQIGNSWESKAGKNLIVSILLKPEIQASDQFVISKIICLSLVELLTNLDIEDVRIKWPNDIYIKDKKIAGVLIQNLIQGKLLKSSVVGIGLNINQIRFDSTAPNPTSIQLEKSKEYDVTTLLHLLLDSLEKNYVKFFQSRNSEIDHLYKFLLYRRNEVARFKRKNEEHIFKGVIKDVNKSGQLLIESDAGLQQFGFREITYII